ncbi:MAG: TonB-dependent receptor [Rhodospirillaceae bacterium]|nr:TonB-dependent receptor [Rhodospirillaceae bacterium]
MRKLLLTTVAACATLTTALPSWAQEAQLEEIIVTAQRREESLQKAALTITVVDGAQVENAVNRPEELTSLLPALYVGVSGGMTQIYIRGIGNLGGTSFAESAVGFNVDQVYIGRPTALDAVFFDLERVEVLKGPQGTLYGRNATGGAINLITQKPKIGEFTASLSLEGGNYDLVKGAGTVNIPINDKGAMRFAVQKIDHDGYLSDGYNDQDTTAARWHLLLKPSDTSSVLISADYAHQGGQGDAHTPSFRTCGDWCGPSEPSNRALEKVGAFAATILAPNDDGVGYQDNKFWSVTADLELETSIGMLSIIPSYRTAEIDALYYPSLFRGRILDKSHQSSVEARLSSTNEGPLKWVVGGYYYNEAINGDYSYSHGLALQAQQVQPNIRNKSVAVFGQSTYSLTDEFRLTAGLRYLHDDKTLSGLQRCFSGTLCGAPLGSGLPGTRIVMSEGDDWYNTSYKVGVEWDAGPDSMIYANVSSGFKSGGFFPAAQNATFGPEKLTAYAIGMKNRFMNDRIQLNAEAYWWDDTGHQESHVGTACVAVTSGVCTTFGNVFLTENIGSAEIKGIDLDTIFLVTDNDQIKLNLGYNDAEAKVFRYNVPATAPPSALIACTRTAAPPFITVDCSGNQMPRAPKWTARADYEHRFDLTNGASLTAAASMYVSSSYWASIDYIPGTSQKSYTRSDASLTYRPESERWSIAAWVNNIEDEAVAASAGVKLFANTPGLQLRAPRTYGLRFTAEFGG